MQNQEKTDPTQPPQHGGTPAAINTNVRLFDLVRFMRSELHQANLITDEEYAWLSIEAPMADDPKSGSPSPRRLEDYDELRSQLTAALDEKREVVEAHAKDKATMAAFYSDMENALGEHRVKSYVIAYDIRKIVDRLALAEGLSETLDKAKNGLEWYRGEHPEDASPADAEVQEEIDTALRRWAESRTEGTQPVALTPDGKAYAPTAEQIADTSRATDYLNDTPENRKALASRAVPITPEIVVPFPCELGFASKGGIAKVGEWVWVRFETGQYQGTLTGSGWTHYRITSPTSRPTAREQQ